MPEISLADLAETDENGRPTFHLGAGADGGYVLCSRQQLGTTVRALETDERVSLVRRAGGRPTLVVESHAGEYVIMLDPALDLDRYVPLGPGDVELLAHTSARARFGRRDEDVILLTPWAEEDDVIVVDLDSEAFADVAVVSLRDDATVEWHRNRSDELLVAVHRELRRIGAEPGRRFGVFSNDFGECVCLPDGAPFLPHEDIRRQTLITTDGMLDGVETLDEAAARLRAVADRLTVAVEDGWQLLQPVSDGVAFVERPNA